LLCSCSSDDNASALPPQPSTFYHSFFFIDNQSPYRLYLDRPTRVIDAPANEVTEIDFPKSALDTVKEYPEDLFKNLILFALDSLDNVVGDYGLHMAVEKEWQEEESMVADTFFSNFTLSILESDLNL